MTREEAIRELKADYCGNRIICELHPDKCNQEDCEIWLAIKALETQPDGDAVSRKDAIRIVDSIDTWQAGWRGNAIESLKALPSAQPEIIRCNQCEHYQGVHGVQGHAPCSLWGSGGVLWNWFCSRAEEWKKDG